jgi:hypothetical protein
MPRLNLIHIYNGLDGRVATTRDTDTRRFMTDADGRAIGEYGSSATDDLVKICDAGRCSVPRAGWCAEFLPWSSPFRGRRRRHETGVTGKSARSGAHLSAHKPVSRR